MTLYSEILDQPEILRGILETQIPNTIKVADVIRKQEIDYVFLAGRGTSDYAGIYAQYVWGSLNQLPVAFAAPSLFTKYAEPPRLRHALVVGISQSGQSPDIVQVISEGKRQGATTLVITNDLNSPLAQAADLTLDVHAGQEKAVAATKTYTAELMTIALLSAALNNADNTNINIINTIPDRIHLILEQDNYIATIAARHKAMQLCVILGRGYNYATAWEWSLKLKELAYVLAHPYSIADFLHGPIALIEPGFHVMAVAPSGATFPEIIDSLKKLRHEQGADILLLSDQEEALQVGWNAIRLPNDIPEWLSPIISIIPAQLYTYHLAVIKGYDTDKPRSLHKVTLTS